MINEILLYGCFGLSLTIIGVWIIKKIKEPQFYEYWYGLDS